MTVDATDLNLSPSITHNHLLAGMRQQLAYDGGDIATWQRKLRAKLDELFRYDRMLADKTPRNLRSLWKRDHPLGTIEKCVFTSEAGSDVPCYLCLPANARPPYPVFICLQGHTTGMHNSIAVSFDDESQPIEVAGDRDFALGCMQRGIAALCIEQRSFGERAEQRLFRIAKGNQCHDAVLQALMVGRTLNGERIHDVEVAIELLRARDDMDMSRLGLMGNSTGGTVALYAAALYPEKVPMAMPSCCFCTYEAAHMSGSRCGCSYIPDVLHWAEYADIAGLYAPNPLVLVAGREDHLLPWAGVEKAYAALKRIYRAAGAEENLHLVVGEEGHRFYAEQAWAVMLPIVQGQRG